MENIKWKKNVTGFNPTTDESWNIGFGNITFHKVKLETKILNSVRVLFFVVLNMFVGLNYLEFGEVNSK